MIERAKIYSDGNHFIAIPETKSENRKRKSVVPKQYTDEERRALDKRNLLIRKIRFVRKAYLNRFNYFATFTYDSAKHTEHTFKKGLSSSLAKLHSRKGWKYMGVWERSERDRLHFHALIFVPQDAMVGELFEKRDYDTRSKRMRLTIQNTYFNQRFGRSDFESIDQSIKQLYNGILQYLLKYLAKSGEKITYSRGLPSYITADIADDDVVTEMGLWSQKLLLFDNATLYDEGEILGTLDDDALIQKLTQKAIKK